MEVTENLLRKINVMPERFPNSTNSKWIRIHLFSGKSCLGYYSFKESAWREFHDILNLHNTTVINDKFIKGWHY